MKVYESWFVRKEAADLGLTVKDFAKTLKKKDDALLENEGCWLSHSKPSDEITLLIN